MVCLKEADSVGIIRDTNRGEFNSLESSVHAKQPLCIINGRDRLNREILWAWRAHFGHTLTKKRTAFKKVFRERLKEKD